MCGRHSLKAPPERIATVFNLPTVPDWAPRYNIAPSQEMLTVLRETKGSTREARLLRWGLIPGWAPDASFGNKTVNARSETASTSAAFRSSFRRRRCLIVTDGFYEWQRQGTRKQPYFIARPDGEPFAFAGLWDIWTPPDGDAVQSCTILTITSNALMQPIHDRMPVILPPDAWDTWLDPAIEVPEAVQPLMKPYGGDDLIATTVGDWVNSPKHEGPRCLEPPQANPQMELFGK